MTEKLIESRRAMKMFYGEQYPDKVEDFKLYVMAQMSRSHCDELTAVEKLSRKLAHLRRLTGLTLAMLESAALELITQSPILFHARLARGRRNQKAGPPKRSARPAGTVLPQTEALDDVMRLGASRARF